MSASKRRSHWVSAMTIPLRHYVSSTPFLNSACRGDKKSTRAASPTGKWNIEVSFSDIET